MKFMGMGGEKYSKEVLDEAIKKRDNKYLSYYRFGEGREEIRERIEKLFKTAKKEATEINNEYDKKMAEIVDEISNLAEFAINKLDMDEIKLKEVLKDTIDGILRGIYYNTEGADTRSMESGEESE